MRSEETTPCLSRLHLGDPSGPQSVLNLHLWAVRGQEGEEAASASAARTGEDNGGGCDFWVPPGSTGRYHHQPYHQALRSKASLVPRFGT